MATSRTRLHSARLCPALGRVLHQAASRPGPRPLAWSLYGEARRADFMRIYKGLSPCWASQLKSVLKSKGIDFKWAVAALKRCYFNEEEDQLIFGELPGPGKQLRASQAGGKIAISRHSNDH